MLFSKHAYLLSYYNLHLEYIQSNKLSNVTNLLSLHRPAHQVLAFSCLSQGMLSARQTTWKHSYPQTLCGPTLEVKVFTCYLQYIYF